MSSDGTSKVRHSAVPPGLERIAPLNSALPRWVKLSPLLQGFWSGIVFCALAAPAFAADHPPLPQGSECLSCHTEKAKGQSVHFDFTHACAVCHVVNAADGRTSITLVLAREKICYSCHEKDAMDRVPYMQGECVSCHDPHTSQRAHLLRANVPTPGEKPKP